MDLDFADIDVDFVDDFFMRVGFSLAEDSLVYWTGLLRLLALVLPFDFAGVEVFVVFVSFARVKLMLFFDDDFVDPTSKSVDVAPLPLPLPLPPPEVSVLSRYI